MALTLTPLMSAYLFKPKPGAIEDEYTLDQMDVGELMAPHYEAPPGAIGHVVYLGFLKYYFNFERFFGRIISWGIHYKWIVVTATGALIWMTLVLYDTLGQEQMPLTDTSLMLGYVRAQPGTSAERMAERLRAYRAIACMGPVFHRLRGKPGERGTDDSEFNDCAQRARRDSLGYPGTACESSQSRIAGS